MSPDQLPPRPISRRDFSFRRVPEFLTTFVAAPATAAAIIGRCSEPASQRHVEIIPPTPLPSPEVAKGFEYHLPRIAWMIKTHMDITAPNAAPFWDEFFDWLEWAKPNARELRSKIHIMNDTYDSGGRIISAFYAITYPRDYNSPDTSPNISMSITQTRNSQGNKPILNEWIETHFAIDHQVMTGVRTSDIMRTSRNWANPNYAAWSVDAMQSLGNEVLAHKNNKSWDTVSEMVEVGGIKKSGIYGIVRDTSLFVTSGLQFVHSNGVASSQTSYYF